MASSSSKKSGAAQAQGTSEAPRTATPTGAGPDVTGTGFSGNPPALSDQRHGGAALEGEPPKGATPAAGQAEDTGPVVENTGGGLQFERKPSGTRAVQRKEQPTTPERAEIVEARRLEQEQQRSRQNPATAAGSGAEKAGQIGGRARVLRNAASGWEMGTIRNVGGGFAMIELDGGEMHGAEPGRWEPAVGALAAPQLDNRDLKSQGGTIDREGQDRAADQAQAGLNTGTMGQDAKSAQRGAKPARKGRTAEQKAARRKSAKKASS
jgi:hypothetical protein